MAKSRTVKQDNQSPEKIQEISTVSVEQYGAREYLFQLLWKLFQETSMVYALLKYFNKISLPCCSSGSPLMNYINYTFRYLKMITREEDADVSICTIIYELSFKTYLEPHNAIVVLAHKYSH